jgi:pyruvate-ferredoxin/flavodoxin oxidoreductase
MCHGLHQQQLAVACGHWPLFRYDPRRRSEPGGHPFVFDSRPPARPFAEYAEGETRYRLLHAPDAAAMAEAVDADIQSRWRMYQAFAGAMEPPGGQTRN